MPQKTSRTTGSLMGLRACIGAAIAATIIFGATASLTGCAAKEKGAQGIVVAVSILPQQYFLERIGGNRVTALVLVGPGQNPHSYEPTPRQMASLAGARAWIKSGTDFELALEPKIRSQYPALRIVDGTAGVAFRKLEKHSHEGEGEDHDDDAPTAGNSESDGAMPTELNIDRHTWLGREPAKIMAGWIRDTLTAIDPDGADVYRANCAALVADIDREFDGLKTKLASLAGSKVFVFHPSFGYYLDEFGIAQEAVETGGKEPTAQALAKLIDEAKRDKPAAIFVQAQFPVSAAKKIADSVGAKVVPLDPLAPDWLDNIGRIGDALEKNAKETVKRGAENAK